MSGFAKVVRKQTKVKRGRMRQYDYNVVQNGRVVKSYSTAVYPALGVGGAKDRAQGHARRINGGG